MAIVGKTIRLRPFERSDIPLKVRWINDPEVYEYLSYEVPLSVGRTEAWFQKAVTDPARRDFLIETLDGAAIGLAGLVQIDTRYRTSDFYVAIGERDFWGKGVALEAEALVIKWAFDNLDLHKVWTEAWVDNVAAIIVMKKLGFKIEGTFREHRYLRGRRVDVIRTGLLRHEFRPPPGLFDGKED